MAAFLLIDKPAGITSFDIIRRLRKICSIRKMGHTGTLDPFATGLMIIAIGAYTRLCSYLEARSKTYEATLKFGYCTDTGDDTGSIVARSTQEPDVSKLESLREQVLALTKLAVPQYSAVKIDGVRAYKYARDKIEIAIPKREVSIYDFEVLSLTNNLLTYRCQVSKGTYIRSLSEWIASYLGTMGTTSALRRISIDQIRVSEAVSLPDISAENWLDYRCSESELFSFLPAITLEQREIEALLQGKSLPYAGENLEDIVVYDAVGKIRSIAQSRAGQITPKINLAGI